MKDKKNPIVKPALSRQLVDKLVVMISYKNGAPVTQPEAIEEAIRQYMDSAKPATK